MVTVAELLAGTQIDAPRLTGGNLTFKTTPKKKGRTLNNSGLSERASPKSFPPA